MAQALRREDSVQCSIAELRRIEDARQTEERAEAQRKQLEEERLRAEAERLRAWEQEVRAASELQAEELAHIRADRVILAERIARAEENARLGEQRLRLELERIVTEREMTQQTQLPAKRSWLPGVVLALVVLAQGYLVAAHIQAGHRAERTAAEIETVSDRVGRTNAELGALEHALHEVTEALEQEPAVAPEATPRTKPAATKPKRGKRTRGDGARRANPPKTPEEGGLIDEKNCDFDSPLC
jgi:hypothetical protein